MINTLPATPSRESTGLANLRTFAGHSMHGGWEHDGEGRRLFSVYTAGTRIAYCYDGEQPSVSTAKYSPTTTRHQGLCRAWLGHARLARLSSPRPDSRTTAWWPSTLRGLASHGRTQEQRERIMTTEKGRERHRRYNHSEKGRERACEYWRRKAGWYEPGGMATDEEMANLRELGRKFRLSKNQRNDHV